jgi:hypothetical protein
MRGRSSWHAWTERGWRDEVAPDDEDLAGFHADIDGLVDDMHDMARTVIECTVEPLREFAHGLPRSMAYESKEWRRAWKDGMRQARGWRWR